MTAALKLIELLHLCKTMFSSIIWEWSKLRLVCFSWKQNHLTVFQFSLSKSHIFFLNLETMHNVKYFLFIYVSIYNLFAFLTILNDQIINPRFSMHSHILLFLHRSQRSPHHHPKPQVWYPIFNMPFHISVIAWIWYIPSLFSFHFKLLWDQWGIKRA